LWRVAVLKPRKRPEVVKRIAEVYLQDPFLGKALALGYKVLTDRRYPQFESMVLAGRYGEAGVYALAMAKSPAVIKFGNWGAPKGGFRELGRVTEALVPQGDIGALEWAVRLKTEADEAEALLLMEFAEVGAPEVLAKLVRAVGEHLPIDRRLQASVPVSPLVGEKQKEEVRV